MRLAKAIFCGLTALTSLFAGDQDHLPMGGNGEIIHHEGFTLQYDNEREQARWVAYELTKNEVLSKIAKRRDDFRVDPEVDLGSATLNDYRGSGFDRGHLVPAADLAWSHDSMSDSFFLSNMSPQDPSFNRGIWKKLEEQVRTWAINNRVIHVVTGPLYLADRGAIGSSHVDIPSHYYKVIFDGFGEDRKGIALVLANEKSKSHLSSFVVSIDKIEELTDLDFLSSLEDTFEEQIEGNSKASQWSWTTSSTNYSSHSYSPKAEEDDDTQGEGIYWITKSSKKRHNSGCRYFKKSKGSFGAAHEGVACKACGG